MDSINVGSRICLGGEGLGLYSGKAITIHIKNLSVNIKIGSSGKKNSSFAREIDAIYDSFKKFGYHISTPELIISTTIPSGYGLASSAALMFAIAIAYNKYNEINCSSNELEDIAYYAEHKILNVLVGKTDTYAVSRGGMQFQDHSVTPSKIIQNLNKDIFNDYVFFVIGSHPTDYRKIGLIIQQKSIKGNVGFKRYKENVNLILPLLWDNIMKNNVLISSKLINNLYLSLKNDLEINNPDYDFLIKLAYENGAVAAKNIGLRVTGGSIYAIVPTRISHEFQQALKGKVDFITEVETLVN